MLGRQSTAAALLAATLWLSGGAHAQETPAPVAPVAPAPAAPATTAPAASGTAAPGTTAKSDPNQPGLITSPTYVISIDDTLEVSISTLDGFGPTIANRTLVVLSDGTSDLPFIGDTKIVGMTLADLKKKLRKAVDKQVEKPNISVAVRGRYQKLVNVFGPVTNKGKLPLRDNWRIRDVIAASGGLPTDRYDFLTASLLRNRSGEIIPIDLTKLLVENDPTQNLLVESEDTLYIREKDAAETQVQVIGEVSRPGPVIMPRSHSIVDVLQAAGGPTPRAALSQVTIERGGKSLIVDLAEYRKTGKEPNVLLEAGDRLVVPENKREYYLYGSVGNGGVQPYPEDRKLTVYSAIALSGGKVEGAELKNVRLTRKNSDGTPKLTTNVNVEKMLKTGDLTGDVPVEPGDSLYVPSAGHRKGITLQDAVGFVTGVSILLGVSRYFKK